MENQAIHPVQPAQVEFENALDRLVYVQTISIRNYCDKARRVRIEGPAARGPFSLLFTPGPSLAPGLELTADVQFVLPDADSAARAEETETGVVYRDRLLVHFGNGDQKVEVPLRAVTPQARILPEAIDFDVILQGDGLLGEPRFTLEASEQAGTYELFYTPLIAQAHTGSVVFLNDRVGEFWYRLNLSAAPAEPTRLDLLQCAVGARTCRRTPRRRSSSRCT